MSEIRKHAWNSLPADSIHFLPGSGYGIAKGGCGLTDGTWYVHYTNEDGSMDIYPFPWWLCEFIKGREIQAAADTRSAVRKAIGAAGL